MTVVVDRETTGIRIHRTTLYSLPKKSIKEKTGTDEGRSGTNTVIVRLGMYVSHRVFSVAFITLKVVVT